MKDERHTLHYAVRVRAGFPVPFLLCLCLLSWLMASCRQGNTHGGVEAGTKRARDLPGIRERDTITAVTLYGSTSYFLYKLQAMGYEYELMADFARTQGVELEVKVARDDGELFRMLDDGEADVIAYPVIYSSQNLQDYIHCGLEEQSCQVLVQRSNKEDTVLTDVTQLIGKDIYIKRHSPYEKRLENLNRETGGDIRIRYIESDSVANEDLIAMVSKGEIPYTVCDENIARLNRTYYWNINTDLKISFEQRSSWVVRKDSPELANAIDAWASDIGSGRSFSAITKRYYELGKLPETAVPMPVKAGDISPYDDIFRKYARLIGWDWRLLASISYQESHFDPDVVAWTGAEGLMGIMPSTAKALGVMPHELKDPDTGIRTGVDCLRRFRQGFSSVPDPEEIIKFTIASYNAGIGHIYDAQRLARKYGKDPNVWDNNVADFIRLKSEPQYYNDPVCRHGYLRGSETYDYVKEIMERYDGYCLAGQGEG